MKYLGAITDDKDLVNKKYVDDSIPTDFTGTDGNTDGTNGLVPAPKTTDSGKFLKADGTWATPSGGGGGGTSDYTDLSNKPSINTVTLSGNKSSSDLSLADASHTHTTSDITDFPSLATVATSGDYDDLTNKPTIPDVSGKIDTAGTGLSKSGTTLNHSNSITAQTTQGLYPIKIDAQGHITAYGSAQTIPTVNNATLTIQKNGTTVNTFTANASSNVTANISVPTSASDVGAVATSRITGSAEAGKIPEIGSNGVMELPQILDLHNSTLDYDVRIITTTTGTKGQATLNIRCGKLQFWGVDSDYIVEQGTNYRKWYSGLAECWGTATNGSGGHVAVTFPLTFKATPVCVASAHYLSGGTYVAPTVSVAPSTTGATFYLRVSTSTVTQGHTVSYEAKGKWK